MTSKGTKIYIPIFISGRAKYSFDAEIPGVYTDHIKAGTKLVTVLFDNKWSISEFEVDDCDLREDIDDEFSRLIREYQRVLNEILDSGEDLPENFEQDTEKMKETLRGELLKTLIGMIDFETIETTIDSIVNLCRQHSEAHHAWLADSYYGDGWVVDIEMRELE